MAENFNRLSRVHERYRETTDNRRTGDSIQYGDELTFAKNRLTVDEVIVKSPTPFFETL